jgi:hypothetical protein
MDFLGTIRPGEMQAGQALSFATMVALLGPGLIPPLRPFGYWIRLVAAIVYIGCLLGFVLYCVLLR